MRILALFLVIFVCFGCIGYSSVILVGKVVDVDDGDTLTIVSQGRYYKIRLLGIDTPETKRNAKFKKDTTKYYVNNEFNVFINIPPRELLNIGLMAKRELRGLVYGKEVKVEVEGVDRYGRNLGWIWLGDIFVNGYMVEKGLARPYMLKGKYKDRILRSAKIAKEKKVGIYRY